MNNILKLVLKISKNMSKLLCKSNEILTEILFQWTNLNLFFIDGTLEAMWDTTMSFIVTH